MANEKKSTTTTTTTTTRVSSNVPPSNASSTPHRSGSHYRFHVWVTLMVLSLVSLLAVIDITDEKQTRDFQERWSLAVAAISMSVAFLACAGHAVYSLRDRFVSSMMELLLVSGCYANYHEKQVAGRLSTGVVLIWCFIPFPTSSQRPKMG